MPDICCQPRGTAVAGRGTGVEAVARDTGTRGLPKTRGAITAPTSAGKLCGLLARRGSRCELSVPDTAFFPPAAGAFG